MKNYTKYIVAFFLRGSSAFAKLAFVIYLGYAGDSKLIGEYGLIVTLTIIFSQLAGLEIHQYVVRDLHKLSLGQKEKIIAQQSLAVGMAYLISISILTCFYSESLGYYWILVVVILIADHYTTELYRYKVAELRIIKATVLISIKNLGWIMALVILTYFKIVQLTLLNILLFWLLSLAVVVLVGMPKISFVKNVFSQLRSLGIIRQTINLVWSCRYLMISAVAISLIGSLDKFIIDLFYPVHELGIYFYTYTIATIPALMIAFTVGLTLWPKCIKLRAQDNMVQYQKSWILLLGFYIGILTTFSILLYFGAPFILSQLNKDFNQETLGLLLVAVGLYTMIEPLKLRLYVEGQDKKIALLNLTHMILTLVLLLVVVELGNMAAVPLALVAANSFALIGFLFVVLKLESNQRLNSVQNEFI